MQCRVVWLLLSIFVLRGSSSQGTEGWRPEPLPKDEEILEALAACPASIREGAAVHVLTTEGFEIVRESVNGFTPLSSVISLERSNRSASTPKARRRRSRRFS